MEEHRCAHREADPEGGISPGRESPLDGGPGIVEPRPARGRVGVAGEQGHQVRRVCSPRRVLFRGRAQPFQGIRAGRLEKAKSRLVALHDVDEGLVYEREQRVDRAAAHRRQRPRGGRAAEDAQAAEHRLLAFGEELVAPIERRAQAAVPGLRGPRAVREDGETVVELGGEPAQTEERNEPGGELEGQRDPVEALAEGDERGHLALTDRERLAERRHAIQQQLHDRRARGLGDGHRPRR